MIIVDAINNITMSGIRISIGESCVIRTTAVSDYANKKARIIVDVMTLKDYREMKQAQESESNVTEDMFPHVLFDQLMQISPEVDWSEQVMSDYRVQNELVMELLPSIGAVNPRIIEDIDELDNESTNK